MLGRTSCEQRPAGKSVTRPTWSPSPSQRDPQKVRSPFSSTLCHSTSQWARAREGKGGAHVTKSHGEGREVPQSTKGACDDVTPLDDIETQAQRCLACCVRSAWIWGMDPRFPHCSQNLLLVVQFWEKNHTEVTSFYFVQAHPSSFISQPINVLFSCFLFY